MGHEHQTRRLLGRRARVKKDVDGGAPSGY
jgi:hypothetical protein